jgi:hypothetical protein
LTQYIYWDDKLLAPFICFAELIKTDSWAVWAEQHSPYLHLISAQTSQEGIKCTKAKQPLRAYCRNIYILCLLISRSKTADPIIPLPPNERRFFFPNVMEGNKNNNKNEHFVTNFIIGLDS